MTGVDLADEDEKFEKYLAENGWTGSIGEETQDNASGYEETEKATY